jgi:microcystin-dependent protein
MSIGNGTNLINEIYQNYTPPDLRKYTMIGKTDATNLKTTVGNDNNTYTITEVPLHNHSIPSTVNHTGITHTHTNVDWSMG